jgi:RNA polymerase sigma factor (sigma-70 family)
MKNLIEQWMPFAVSLARKTPKPPTVQIEDLQQAAFEGLCRAAQTYDESEGAFSTYAAWWIHAYIWKEIGKHSMVPVPRTARDKGVGRTYMVSEVSTKDEGSLSIVEVIKGNSPSAISVINTKTICNKLSELVKDDLDENILNAMITGETFTAVAEKHNVSRQFVQQRVENLRKHVVKLLNAK